MRILFARTVWRAGSGMRVLLTLLIAALPLLTTACGAVRRAEMEEKRQAAAAQAVAERDGCARKFPATMQKTRVAYARCLADVDNRLIRPFFSAPELFDVLVAKRTALASQVEAGVITQEESDYQFAQTKAQVTGELERRGLVRRAVAAQENANSITCTNFGNTVSCY